MKGTIIKEFSQLGTNYRIVETKRQIATAESVDLVPSVVADKYALEYQAEDLVGAPAWRFMCATSAALTDPDPLAVMLRELRAAGWF